MLENKFEGQGRGVTSRLAGVILVAFALSLLAAAQSGNATITQPFSPPTGPFAVGTHEYLWIDQTRGEPFTKDPADRRHLLARVWYPAEVAPAKEPARYVLDASEFPEKSIYRQGQNVKTNAVTDAPLAAGKARFPVLIYQPGGG